MPKECLLIGAEDSTRPETFRAVNPATGAAVEPAFAPSAAALLPVLADSNSWHAPRRIDGRLVLA